MALKWLIPVLVLISVSAAENITVHEQEIVLLYPDDFNSTTTWEIHVDNTGLGVILIVNNTNLDPDDEDHILFSADENMLGESASVVYLTGALSDVWLAIPLVKKAYLTFSVNQYTKDKTATLTLKFYEQRAPEPPVTPPSPFPPSGIETELVVHVKDKTVDQFNEPDFIRKFQKEMQTIAFEFCKGKEIFFNSSKPENETVFINKPQICNDKWPDYETCVQFRLSIYVTNPRSPYELSVTHLTELWNEVEKNGFPVSLGVQPYEFPNVALQILYWLGWLLLAIVITAAISLFLWRVEVRAYDEKRRLIDEEEERRKESIFRGVQLRHQPPRPLKPAKHQKIPEFMITNHDSVSKAATTTPTTKRTFLKNIFSKSEESKVEKPPSPISPQVEHGATRFWKPDSGLFEEATDT